MKEKVRSRQLVIAGAGASMRGQWRLNENEWKALVKNNGDWSVVKVPILTNAPPIENFDEYVRQVREPILHRREGFDDPIRQATEARRKRQEAADRKEDKNTESLSSSAALNESDCHDKVVRQGIETLILPKEIESLFGATNVDHFISKFGSKTQIPVWHSVTYFAGRYRFLLEVPISIDYEKCKFNGAINSAMVQIDELTKIDISRSGDAEATKKGQWSLNQGEWKWLVKNKGDWSVVKIPVLTNSPVSGFDEYVRQERGRPLNNRQEDFDKPIRKAIDALSYPFGIGKGSK